MSKMSINPANSEPETSILGDFELLDKLGEGAMGEVYKAQQISFDRVVALKVLFPHVAKNPKLVERLRREGRAMFHLSHPNIVEAYAVDEADGYHFVAMEYVDGESLQTWLGRLRRFTVADATAIILACARALEYAHGQGMVHRDIKPDNVLIDRNGTVKVADLGMVKSLDEDMALTQTGHAVGTPWYMPLEQARNAKDIDGRSDIYALGCMYYCLLTGNPPFNGQTLVEVIQAKEAGTFPPARKVNPDVSERLDLLLAKMTAKLARHRYQNCAELIKDLTNLSLAGPQLSFLQSNAIPADPEGARSKNPAAERLSDEWFVRVILGESETAVRKISTNQLKKMLEEGTIDPTAKASRQQEEGFRSLATYKEFQGTALVKQTKKAADKQSVKYRTIYKKIEEQERQRDQGSRSDSDHSYYGALWKPGFMIAGGIVGFVVVMWILMSLFGS